jgi:coenzyme PQQ precursor peptide PqqA
MPCEISGKEVMAMEPVAIQPHHPAQWETPVFEEIGVAPEVTAYVARWEDQQ